MCPSHWLPATVGKVWLRLAMQRAGIVVWYISGRRGEQQPTATFVPLEMTMPVVSAQRAGWQVRG